MLSVAVRFRDYTIKPGSAVNVQIHSKKRVTAAIRSGQRRFIPPAIILDFLPGPR